MSAGDMLHPMQFMPVADVGRLRSGDHDVTMDRLAKRGIPHDMRYSRQEMKDFTEHVGAVGVHTPLRIYTPAEGPRKGKPEVADGHHRFVAAKRAGLTHIPVQHFMDEEVPE